MNAIKVFLIKRSDETTYWIPEDRCYLQAGEEILDEQMVREGKGLVLKSGEIIFQDNLMPRYIKLWEKNKKLINPKLNVRVTAEKDLFVFRGYLSNGEETEGSSTFPEFLEVLSEQRKAINRIHK